MVNRKIVCSFDESNFALHAITITAVRATFSRNLIFLEHAGLNNLDLTSFELILHNVDENIWIIFFHNHTNVSGRKWKSGKLHKLTTIQYYQRCKK